VNFALTADQIAIRDMVRDFAATQIKPHVLEWDEAQHFPHDVVEGLAAQGLLGIVFPEQYGAAGLSYIDYVNILEELAAVESGIALIVAAHNSLAIGHIHVAGSEQQKQQWIPKLASGEWLGCWALTEPGSGSDASGMRTIARRDGDDWVISGSKNFITNATHANIAVVLAVTDPADQKHGITAFAIEMDRPASAPGRRRTSSGCGSPTPPS
jgi:alkylation response protein AidB-like acyl-CoA dehydrogenase